MLSCPGLCSLRALVFCLLFCKNQLDMACLHIQELSGKNHMQRQHQSGMVNCLNSFVIVMSSLIVSPAF